MSDSAANYYNALHRDKLVIEVMEQARLLDMSATREAGLVAHIKELKAAIRKHKSVVWGSMKVRDPTARELYAALLGGGEK